ncbi:hypothetical protein E2562_011624 [Oryza meyeriana var. granulata]|uniref:Uncharacterized protein n=1 Tax=Oryza meyeriana var. granulata TaxID=110450 RepID=A0A6G1DYN7_9ORYZ|nr:hypothetical protein E2562_011624 [Oryza meyeriana var. granulata]
MATSSMPAPVATAHSRCLPFRSNRLRRCRVFPARLDCRHHQDRDPSADIHLGLRSNRRLHGYVPHPPRGQCGNMRC